MMSIAEDFFEYCHEYFCFADFLDAGYYCEIDEMETVKEAMEDNSERDVIWEIIKRSFVKYRGMIAEGKDSCKV